MSVNVKEAGGYITTGRIQNTLFWKIGWNLHMSSHFRNFPIFYYKISMKWMLKKLFRRRILHDHAIFHKQNPIRYFSGKIHLMGDDNHGYSFCCYFTDNT